MTAWLIPRRGAVCLVIVRAGKGPRSACRHQLDDTRHPIVLAMEHRIVVAFPDGQRPLSVEPTDRHGFTFDAMLIRNGEEAINIRYRDATGARELPLPDNADGGVRSARPRRSRRETSGRNRAHRRDVWRSRCASCSRAARARGTSARCCRLPAPLWRPGTRSCWPRRGTQRLPLARLDLAPGRAAAWAPVFTPQSPGLVHVLQELFIGLDARAALPGMLAAVEHFAPDLIVRETCEFASTVAAERFGVPPVQVGIHLDTTIDTGEQLLAIAAPALRRLGLREPDASCAHRS